MSYKLPSYHRALVLETAGSGFEVKTLPTPQPGPGSVVVRIIASGTLSYFREIYSGERQYPYPTPIVGGFSAIARVAAAGPDTTMIWPEQLVYVDCVVRARDDPCAHFMISIHEGASDGTRKLMREVWRDGTLAEYAKVPLENCIPLNELVLCQSLGYSIQDLVYMCYLLVPYGGLRDIRLEPGETVVVSPATGGFGGAAVQVAVAMGAKVIAMGRNEKELDRLKDHVRISTPGACVETVKITGDEGTDLAALQAHGTIDAVLDISPPAATNSTHLRAAIMALRPEGRCSLMGFAEGIPAMKVITTNITLKGKFMYAREDMLHLVKMLERGLFPRGKGFVDTKSYGFANWKEGFDIAAEHTGLGRFVVFEP
jgi:threonine dehydrogenase-like Zn-dependent dehydrogenase